MCTILFLQGNLVMFNLGLLCFVTSVVIKRVPSFCCQSYLSNVGRVRLPMILVINYIDSKLQLYLLFRKHQKISLFILLKILTCALFMLNMLIFYKKTCSLLIISVESVVIFLRKYYCEDCVIVKVGYKVLEIHRCMVSGK